MTAVSAQLQRGLSTYMLRERNAKLRKAARRDGAQAEE